MIMMIRCSLQAIFDEGIDDDRQLYVEEMDDHDDRGRAIH
jgi:hypothetical protein